MNINAETIFYALIGGILPAVLWLWFWLHEDRKRPEPRGLIMLTFFAGMLAVPLVIPLQKATFNADSQLLTFFFWATIEELAKYGAAFIAALRRKEMNEPVDALIYLMTAALGFVAIENALFILSPLLKGNVTESIITGNLRFVGASLLHTISSAAIGISIAFAFYRRKTVKRVFLWIGIAAAIALHTLFNFFIMKEADSVTLATFGFVWIAIVILMLFFEKIKTIYPVNKI